MRRKAERKAPLVTLMAAGVSRGGSPLLGPIDFRLEQGARWALFGANGAGKSTFLRLLRGELPPDQGGGRVYDLPGAGGPQSTPLGLRQRLAMVAGDMQDAFAIHGWAATGLDVVLSGFGDGPLLYAPPEPEQVSAALGLLDALGLSDLSGRRMARLSSGEGRRLLLARALVSRPDVLLLDECLEGLDVEARREFLALLDRVAMARPLLAVVFATHRLDELPTCLTSALALEDGHVRAFGALGDVLPGLVCVSEAVPESHVKSLVAMPGDTPAATEFLVRITNASVDMEARRILDGINWTLRPGEHWAVLGPNGAGKSTLLSLLAGLVWPSAVDGPPGMVEYGFAAPDEPLSNGTVDEMRRRIGVVSEALQTGFPYDLPVESAVATGLDGSLDVFAEPDAAGWEHVAKWLDYFELAKLRRRRVRSLSRGQFRRVLLARAMVGNPVLLVLDEPMAGLDSRARAAARELLGQLAAQGQPLVMVTHHEADLPGCFLSEAGGRVLALRGGRVAYCGEWGGYSKWKAARKAGRRSLES